MLRSDRALEAEVAAEIASDVRCGGAHVAVAVTHGVVRLSGFVTDPAHRHAAVCAAKRVFGIDGIEARIEVAVAAAAAVSTPIAFEQKPAL